jgi:tetratricopeptide (TPR) repeat protein
MPVSDFFQRMRERKVFQVFLVYLGVGWALAEVSEFVVDNYGLSQRFLHVVVFLIVIGLPVALVLAWFHGEKGHQRVQKVEAAILAALVVVGIVGGIRIASRTVVPTVAADEVFVDLGDASVAVLPFDNRLRDPELDWLGPGTSELLTTGLAQVASLRVVSGQRLFDLARQEGVEDESHIPDALASRIAIRSGAHYMVEGSILGTSDDMTITASLINLQDGGVVAASKARGSDVFLLVDSITANLAGQVLGAVEPTELASVAEVATGNLDAFREYQLGLEAHRRFRWADAKAHYEKALELDPGFALAYLQLALTQFFAGDFTQGVQNMQRASENLTAASERDQLFLDGMIGLMLRNDPVTGRAKLRDLVNKYPDEKEGRAWLWRMTADSDERLQLMQDALKLDPFNTTALNELAYSRARAGDFAAADSLIARYVALQPEEPNPRDSQGEIFELAENFAAARGAYAKALELDPAFYLSLDHLTRAYFRDDMPTEAREALRPFTAVTNPQTRFEATLLTADTYTWSGDFDAALGLIEDALAYAREQQQPELESRGLIAWYIPLAVATHRFEGLEAAFTRTRELDPFNPMPAVYAIQSFGERGRVDEMVQLRDIIEAALGGNPQTARALAVLLPTLDSYIAFYRGDLEGAATQEGLQQSMLALGQIGKPVFPNLRPLVELGRGDEALVLANRMERSQTNIGAGLNRFDPLDYHLARYYQGRAHELLADTAQAIEAYRTVVDHWGASIADVSEVADVAQRLEMLRSN